jgi:hypothetical protein
MAERAISTVPGAVLALLAAALASQLALKALEPRPAATAADLPPAPPTAALRLASLGEPIAAANLLSLYLQAFDTQPGISIPFQDLDYDRVEDWLIRVLELDPPGQYPLLMASQVYSQVPDEKKQRQMLDLAYRQFLLDPNRRWRWLAHAAIMAKHRLKDPDLALRYARAINQYATSTEVPHWAKQMHILCSRTWANTRPPNPSRRTAGKRRDHRCARGRFLTERLKALEAVERSSKSSDSRLQHHRRVMSPSGQSGAKDPHGDFLSFFICLYSLLAKWTEPKKTEMEFLGKLS